MTETPGLQQFFFQQIREKIPDNMSFVHEIAELLEISYDSAYRRIRGEKELSLEELVKLSKKFNLSLDALAGLDLNHVVFRKFALHPGDFSIKDWLLQIKDDIRRIQAARNPEIIYAAKLLSTQPQPVQPSTSLAVFQILTFFMLNIFSYEEFPTFDTR